MSIAKEVRSKLEVGLAAMAIDLSQEQVEKLVAYVMLIDKWNKVYNVTAIRDPLQMVTLHILDSLSVLKIVARFEAKNLLDVGAGAGLPSIPLAICLPALKVHAIDSVLKKESFMRHVKGELNIGNLTIESGRVEKLSKAKFNEGAGFDLIISRAFAEIALFTKLTKQIISEDGLWLAMKGVVPELEFEKVSIDIQEVVKLEVPALEAERHLIIYKS